MQSESVILKKWKIFWAWEDERETAWLQSMSQKGWHLKKVAPFRYTFTTGKPLNYTYGIDYVTIKKNDLPEYLDIYETLGWELAATLSGYYYFRIDADKNPDRDIFSNNESRIKKYRSILLILAVVSFPLWFILLTGRATDMISQSGIVGIIYKTAFIIYIPIAILYITAFIKLMRKINAYKKKIEE